MKRNFFRSLCIIMVAVFVLNSLTPAMAWWGDDNYSYSELVNGIYSHLCSARNIVANSMVYMDTQNARWHLKKADKLLNKRDIDRYFDRRLDRVIDKAKMEILWNNKYEALGHINHAMYIVEGGSYNVPMQKGGSANSSASGSASTGAIVATAGAVGFGALLAGIFGGFNWGGFSTNIPMPNVPGSAVRVH
jgi:hypothetical protein